MAKIAHETGRGNDPLGQPDQSVDQAAGATAAETSILEILGEQTRRSLTAPERWLRSRRYRAISSAAASAGSAD